MSVGAIGALSGAAVGLGLACGIAAFRAEPPTRRFRLGQRFSPAKLKGDSRKLAGCVGAGVAVGLA